jgi:hypothetical protein
MQNGTKVYNGSKFPVRVVSKENREKVIIPPLSTKYTSVEEGDKFYAIRIPHRDYVHIGQMPKKQSQVFVGFPTEYTDDVIWSGRTRLKPYTGGVAWVELMNMTNVPLSFQDGAFENGDVFTMAPYTTYKYKGRNHWGVNYGTYIKNVDGVFAPYQILSPITHLIYGVLN